MIKTQSNQLFIQPFPKLFGMADLIQGETVAQVINTKKLEEENKKLKEDIMVLQDTINKIDDRLRSLFGVDNFGYKDDLSIYNKFCGDKKCCEAVIQRLKNITEFCDKAMLEYLIPDEPINRYDEWKQKIYYVLQQLPQ